MAIRKEIYRTRSQQSGVALMSALLVLALAGLLAYALIDDTARMIERARGVQASAQAQALAEGLYDYALLALIKEQRETGLVDSNNEVWAQDLPNFPTPRGLLGGKLEDLNGRLNLNGLWRANRAEREQTRVRLERLLQLLKLDPRLAGLLTDAIDRDENSEFGGEDALQMGQVRPSRAPNVKLVHASEIASVIGEEAYYRLAPFICALNATSALNVNTAKPLVLQSLHPAISPEIAERLYDKGKASFADVPAFVAALAQMGVVLDGEQQRDLAVGSTHFLARANVLWMNERFQYTAMLERSPGVVEVRWRVRGEFE
jgi:general secretion pathway protein K